MEETMCGDLFTIDSLWEVDSDENYAIVKHG
jgi:hypothetical protein